MKYNNDHVSDIKIAYIGGGSRGWAWTFMTDLAMEKQISGTIYLYDIDRKAAQANEFIGNRLMQRADAVGNWRFEEKGSLEEALTGADFTVISILPKTFDEMEVDVHMPERLGIYQSVGDTAGPGGIMRALRTLPIYVEFARAIEKYFPEAWVSNYTNPMSLCVRTLYETFPKIKAFGCCHEVFGTQQLLARMTEEMLGIKEVKREDIHVNVLGINHFTWFDYASYKGHDLFPLYRKFIDKYYYEGYVDQEKHWMNSTFECAHRVKMDLFRRYGLIAAAGDRHLAEFMPGQDYLKDPETVHSWKFGLTTVKWRKEDQKARIEKSKRLVALEEEIELKPTGEEGILLIKALCGLKRVISNVNIPNHSLQIANLPSNALVETNAVFDRDAIRPVVAGELPVNIKELVMPHLKNHDLIMQYVTSENKDMELLCEAFMNDPLVKGRASKEDVEKLIKDMLAATMN